MSYALSTTKRKFHRILDSISNSSNTSLPLNSPEGSTSTTTLSASREPPTKKPRIARPERGRVTSVSRVIGKEHAVRSTPTLPGPEWKRPHFTPWDRADFLERLKSFRHVHMWLSKPSVINEVQWAKRGWTCVGKERIRCVGCAREIVIRLENEEQVAEAEDKGDPPEEDWRVAAHKQLVEKYTEMIISEHDEGCLWRARGCDATIYRLSLAHPPTSFKNLLERYESLTAVASELPTTLVTPPELDIPNLCQQMSIILRVQASGESPADGALPKSLNEQALALALLGWRADSDHTVSVATCDACFRRLGLWLYKSRLGSDEPTASCLDVVDEHRDYCPWVNGASQSGSQEGLKNVLVVAELAGWEVLIQSLRNLHQAKMMLSSTSNEGMDGTVDEVDSPRDVVEDPVARDAKDKERWAKLKKLKEVFQIKRVKGSGNQKSIG